MTKLDRPVTALVGLLLSSVAIAGCWGGRKDPPKPYVSDQQKRYDAIAQYIATLSPEEGYGEGGQQVLRTALDGLTLQHREGRCLMVSIEDLWAHSLQEGQALFNQPDRLWGVTTAAETGDMLGNATVGPWQMTIRNVRAIYGKPYGVDPGWDDAATVAYLKARPVVQARMIADYIQLSYESLGQRTPYAIQRYFWLEPFVRGDIGQGPWDASVVAKGGTSMHDTGFYAKQILLGSSYNSRGMLFWFLVTGDEMTARRILTKWRDQQVLCEKEGATPEQLAYVP